MYKILKNERIAPDEDLFVLDSPRIARKAKPGQFVVIRLKEEGERIPLTIADLSQEDGTITIIIQEIGKTTREMGKKKGGDTILDVVGPLGKPSEIEKQGTVVAVGGGVGIAVVYLWAKAMREAGNRVISILGARSKDYLFWEEKIASVSDEVLVTTDDGSYKRKGLVTDALKDLMDREKIGFVFAVGPTIMMQAVADATRLKGIRTIVSLNPIMVDATGMCGACRLEVGGETKFVCVDGPDFDGHKVDFELLKARQKIYLEEERGP